MPINDLNEATKRDKYLRSKGGCKARSKRRGKKKNKEANGVDICDEGVKRLRKLC